MTFALFAFWAAAYMDDPPLKSVEPEAPPIEIGVLAGRDGVAFGPGIILQGNLGRLGLYGFAGTSSITGYSTSDGVKANLRDRTLGLVSNTGLRAWESISQSADSPKLPISGATCMQPTSIRISR